MNILLTSVGRRTYMVKYFQKALSETGTVHAANSDSYALAMYQADKFIISPMIYNENYIEFLLEYCRENSISVIIPLFDIDLPVLAAARNQFEKQGIHVVVSDFETIQICNDKWKSYKFLISNNIPTPASFISTRDCLEAINNNKINFPLIIKPRWGMGSIGIYQVDNLNELEILYQRAKKDILDTYLKYESSVDIDSSVIIQEKLQGEEYGIDILNDLEGNFVTCIPKRKIAMRAGETDGAIILENMDLYKLGKKISMKLKHIANLDVDCFLTNGNYYVLEMNCRFGGQYPFCHLAGADFPKAIISMLRREHVNKELLFATPGTLGVKDIEPKILNRN